MVGDYDLYHREYTPYTKDELDLLINEFYGCKFFTAKLLQGIFHKQKYNNRSIYNALKNVSPDLHYGYIPAAMYEIQLENIPLLINDNVFKMDTIRVIFGWRMRIGK